MYMVCVCVWLKLCFTSSSVVWFEGAQSADISPYSDHTLCVCVCVVTSPQWPY